MAKAVNLVAVRVFDCTGGSTWERIIAGIDWVIGHHGAGVPAVANMSLGGGARASVDTATNNLINDGVAIDVPLMVLVAVFDVYQAEVMLTPGANQSTQLP